MRPRRHDRDAAPDLCPAAGGKGEPPPLGLALADLEPGQCKWPHGDGPFVFCGHPAVAGEAYCPAHKARAFRPYEPKTRATFTFRRARAAA